MVSRITAALAARNKAIQEKEKGFTLIELLVVVIIIGVLAAIAIPVYLGVQNSAKDSAVQADLTNAKTAVVAAQTKGNGTLPADMAALQASGYTLPDASNYTTGGTVSYAKNTAGTGFCLAGLSASGTSFAVTESSSAKKGSCSAAGAFVAPTAP